MTLGTKLHRLIAAEMEEIGMQEGSPEFFVGVFKRALAADPTFIEVLAPGKRLVQSPMTPAERGAICIPAMNKARLQYRDEMKEALIPVISSVRHRKRDASVHEITNELNTTMYGPAKGRKLWTFADTVRLLKEINIEH